MPRTQRGFTLPEVMVGITIGLLLLAAFLATLDRCRASFAASASVASLHDGARYALSVLVPDLEHAGFFGFATSAQPQLARAGAITADAAALHQPDAARSTAPAAGVPAGSHDCGTNFAVDITLPVQMSNNSYPAGATSRCAPTAAAGGARDGSDTLTIRRASLETSAPRAGRLQIYARRLQSHGFATLFGDGSPPGPPDAGAEVRDLEVHTYYIANHSVGRPGWPALRVKSLTESGGSAQFRDEEVLPGVEDLQVELALADPDSAGISRLHDPSLDSLRKGQLVAVRVWLRIRADQTESGYSDSRALHYADVSFVPAGSEATIRRTVVERTVALRNRPSRR